MEAKMPMSSSLNKTIKMVSVLRTKLNEFPEVNGVLSQSGRSNNGTDLSGFYYVQMQVSLKPKEEWKRKITQDQLIEEIDKKLKRFQGINYNYSQLVFMTALMAAIGLLSAAISTGIGSETQKPLAIGGLITATIPTLLTFPIIYDFLNWKKRLA